MTERVTIGVVAAKLGVGSSEAVSVWVRQAEIAARETRAPARLRAVEYAYQIAIGRDVMFTSSESKTELGFPKRAADKEIEIDDSASRATLAVTDVKR